ncbi:hypothetical protein SAMN05877838_0333 [Hoeflea halophila]|uniref:Uncharacterized protein n=1 Tax=Hoeflea halophila TaxID=714899 RepID=A0A286HMT7_9HYPH|nr:hypothetical protein SAMN05877838_0333 [Hoeflea halophila]
MLTFDRQSTVEHLKELVLNDPIISSFCITSTDQIVGRPCGFDDEVEDQVWWRVHNELMVDLLDSVAHKFK